MSDDSELTRRKSLTFAQAEGLEELPRQLQRDEMSKVLRARLLMTIVEQVEGEMKREGLSNFVGEGWSRILRRLYVEYLGDMSVEFDRSKATNFALLKEAFRNAQPLEVYDLLQALLRTARVVPFSKAVAEVLESERSAYRVLDGDTLVPFGSSEEADTLARAMSDTRSAGLLGAHQHLKESAKQLSAGGFADSVRESIHAVESAVRSLTGKNSVSDALNELAKRRALHESFRRGVMQLYGFGSDEPGVRHALLDSGDAAVMEQDAMFMLGTCAALVTYFSRSFVKA